MIFHAKWFDDHYFVNGWTSTDGDLWFDADGNPAKTFGTIVFHGGPRDGGRRIF